MDQVKSIFASRTIWTNFVTFAASLAAVWGFDFTATEQAEVVTGIVTIGGFLSSYFRVAATKQVAVSPSAAAKAPLVIAILLILPLVAGALSACGELRGAARLYGRTNAVLQATAPKLYAYCLELEGLAAVADATASARLRAAANDADAAVTTFCAARPTSVPAAIATVVGAIGAVRSARAS